MNITDAITEIERFSDSILTLGKPIDEKLIAIFENKYALHLPTDYKTLLKKYNGIGLYGIDVYGIFNKNETYSLTECYAFEHCEVENAMPLYLVPFSPDGGGNHYCFDTRFHNGESCPIVFWQHDYNYTDDDSPEIINANLADWIKTEMIDWTLEDYDYDGQEL